MESEATQKGRNPRKLTHTPSSSSKDSMLTNPTLPQELIAAILVRLPVKYLLGFKCVSKDWLALISSPDFVKAHLRFSAKDYSRHRLLLNCVNEPSNKPLLRSCYVSSLFYKNVTTEAYDLQLPVKTPDISNPIVVGSVNGLVCLCIGSGALALWNPCMRRKFKELPDMRKPTYKFLPMYGFGYDDVHEDYKVVVIFYNSDSKYDAYIFSLKSDSWRRIDDFPGGLTCSDASTLVNGKLYWLMRNDKDIMSYDLVDEKWAKVEPPSSGVGDICLTLGLLGGELCAYHYFLVSHCEVWVMKENGVKESWTNLYTINDSVKYICSEPLFMSNEGEVLLSCGLALAIYNPKDDSTRYPKLTNFSYSVATQLHMESLVCPI